MSALATLLAGVALALGGDEVTLGWRGKESTTAALPEDLPKPARDAIAAWEDWCVEHKYRFDLDEKGKVLFVSRASSGPGNTSASDLPACDSEAVKITSALRWRLIQRSSS